MIKDIEVLPMNLVLDPVPIATLCAQRWQHVEAPIRPCRTQLRIWGEEIDELTRGIDRPRALCLGSSPELRDLLLERGWTLMVLDPNDDVYTIMTDLMAHPRHPNEIYEKIDWREADFPPETFHIVLSDLFLFHLPDLVTIGELYERLESWMAPGASYFTREGVAFPAVLFPSCAQLVHQWRQGEIQNPSDLSYLLLFASDSPVIDAPSGKVDGRLVPILLHTLKQKGVISLEEYEMLSTVALPWEGTLHRPENLRMVMERFFHIRPIHPCLQFISCQTMPMWHLTKL
jgi:hypothetical protein